MMTGVNFIIEVLRGKKVEVERRWETDWTNLSSFKDVFLKVVPDRLKDLPVRVRIGSKKPDKEPNQWVNCRMEQNLALMELQGANFLQFLIPTEGKFHICVTQNWKENIIKQINIL